MAVKWSDDQRARVGEAMAAFPAASARCADLARQLQLVALERDPESYPILIRPRPGSGRYVIPRIGHMGWFHHVSTVVDAHCVDVLTGVAGTPYASYLQEHWESPDRLREELVDLEEPWL